MTLDPNSLAINLGFGLIGTAYFFYGKKQQNLAFLMSGLALIIYGYFTEELWLTAAIGTGLILMPFIFKKFFR